MPHNLSRVFEVERAFSRKALKRVCEAAELSFGEAYEMDRYLCDQPGPEDYYFYKDNGSNVLAVAHLDTVGQADDRTCRFVVTEGAGTVVYSRALDDRLGAYIILELLPLLGLNYDILLTVGEESGQSTAAYFEPPKGKHYDYMIEFDRGGTDVVMYQYDDAEVRQMVKDAGARVGDGSFSDVSYLGHLGIKGFNWGVGYQDYHGPRAHAYLDDTFAMVARYLNFAAQNEGVYMPHEEDDEPVYRGYGGWQLDGPPTPTDYEWDDDGRPVWNDDARDVYAEEDWNEYPSLSQINKILS